MLLRRSRSLALAATLAVLTALPVTLSATSASAAPAGTTLTASDTPPPTGTLTDLLAGLLAALLGGQQSAPSPQPAAPGTAAQAPTPMSINVAFEDRVVRLVNKRRARAGCRTLRPNARLRTSARTHSVGMAQYRTMVHFLPGEAGLGERITYAGYRGWRRLAENIASGFASPRDVMQAWMASPSHRKNILDCRLRQIGVGVIAQGDHLWWTQDFGRR
ncbi:CAP domain-containing protein [Nocardioides daeguensis]|uniref:SCP domain-containing protein n=1 Tax=Nocardioides daeguensis TaxID=908359 RepID=A0ABP6WHU3_9ACTN|nr:CAP domain-containing protein [Nocardioides daeguensis]MBV6727926.1 CAP domain-containing protein [Nocardioides daeguensis]MCR1771669.1 CAP domain-containing protein [Nocardioides daeguensis]